MSVSLPLGRRGIAVTTVTLLAAGVVLTVLAVAVGEVSIPLSDIVSVAAHHLVPWYDGTPDPVADQIAWELRAPRALMALVVGAGLAVSGVALQALTRNGLADPYVLGVASGASLGAVAVIVLGSATVGGLGLSGAAFGGAMLAMLLVFALARSSGGYRPTRLVLAGVALGYLCSSVTSLLQFLADPRELQSVLFWLLGSLGGTTWSDLGLPAAVVAATSGWLLLQGRRLNRLLVGEESAATLGVDVQRFRAELMVVSSVLVGALVAVSGGIGFVGLMIPHVARLLVGSDNRKALPLAALLGAVYLQGMDIASRTVAEAELPIGIFTAAVGTPFFLWLMRRSRRLEIST